MMDLHMLTLTTICYRSNVTITIIITTQPFGDYS